jgi:hypothetical protein
MGSNWNRVAWTFLSLAVLGIAGPSTWADDGDPGCITGGGDNSAAYLAQQAYWQAWDHWLTIYQEHLQAIKEEKERIAQERRDRHLFNPPTTEIWAAEPLNELLADMVKLTRRGTELPTVYLQPELLQHINLTSGLSEGNVSALAGGTRLSWPLSLTGEEFKPHRTRIDSLMATLIGEVKKGQLNKDDMDAMNRALLLLDQELLEHVREWAPNDYMEAKRFAGNIRASLKVLRQPDAQSYFNRDYTPKGKTVAELVAYLDANGLQFAPAAPADKRAYIVFHRALATCDMAANAQAEAAKADAAAEPNPEPQVNAPKPAPAPLRLAGIAPAPRRLVFGR